MYLKQSTEKAVRIGMAVAVGDGFTPVTNLSLATADEAELLKDTGGTVDISGATFAAVTTVDGWYDLTLTTSHTDTVGDLTIVINDDSLILPLWRRLIVLPANVFDSIFGADLLQVDMREKGLSTVGLTAQEKLDVNTEADTALTDYDATIPADIPSAVAIADQVWDEAKAGHVGVGSMGEEVQSHALSTEVALDSTVAKEATVAALNDLSAAEVNTEVVDALNVDTYVEPGQGTPAATTSLAAKINYLYKHWRNRKTQTATTWSLYNDDAATVDQKATVSDNGTTADKTEIETGP